VIHWINRAQELSGEGKHFVIATLWSLDGASPDEAGHRVIVTANNHYGQFNSSYRLQRIAEHSRALLAEKTTQTVVDYQLGNVAGTSNGHYRVVYTACRTMHSTTWIATANRLLDSDTPFVLSQSIDHRQPDTDSVFTVHSDCDQVTTDSSTGIPEMLSQNLATRLLEQPHKQTLLTLIKGFRPVIAVIGNSTVAAKLIEQLQLLPVTTHWLSDSPDLRSSHRVNVMALHEQALRSLRKDARVVIATGDHDLDLRFCKAALNQPHLSYIGCLGSARKAAIVKQKLLQAGVVPERLAALYMPVGLPEITGKRPEIVAASIVGQLLSLGGYQL
jgi:xanthine dehydrogenase accessory factor